MKQLTFDDYLLEQLEQERQAALVQAQQAKAAAEAWKKPARKYRRAMIIGRSLSTEPTLVTDGLGTFAPATCVKCGGRMAVVRPGDIRCEECDN